MNNRQSKWLSPGHDLFMLESATKFNNLILLVINTYDLIKEAKLIGRRIYACHNISINLKHLLLKSIA